MVFTTTGIFTRGSTQTSCGLHVIGRKKERRIVMQNNNVWELALVAQALTNKKEELQKEYRQTKNQQLIEEMHIVKHNLGLINKQLAKNSKNNQ